MRILEFMSFNPSWFLTLPGILITSGVILLLIALILLLTSTKKEDEEEITSKIDESYKPSVEENLSVEPLEIKVPTVENITDSMPIKNEEIITPVENKESEVEQSQINVGGISDIISNNLKIQDVETPVLNETALTEDIGILNINNDNLNQLNNVVEPTISNDIVENVEEPIIPEIPNLETASTISKTPTVSIYGGVNPTLDIHKSDFEPEKPVIYGGADPLENTAPIPTVPRQAYSASVVSTPQVDVNPIPIPVMPATEAKLVDPIAQPTEITPSAIIDTSIDDVISASSVSEDVIETLEI